MSSDRGATVLLEVEVALGPGVDFDAVDGRPVGRRARRGGVWIGFDRAEVVDTDDGAGGALPAVVALPASTFRGCRLEAQVAGAWRDGSRHVVVASLDGMPVPLPALARLAAGMPEEAAWLDADETLAEVARARRRHRERRAHARIVGGRAWHGIGAMRPEEARFATPHSAAEYRLGRLPPRFVRGLAGLLDDDERLLYAIERPEIRDVSVVERVRRREDRRAALLALTDRQLLWFIDHSAPDRYLEDWGVDVETVPLERVLGADADTAPTAPLRIDTPAGPRTYRLPAELADERVVMRNLVARWAPAAAGRRPRRVYEVPTVELDQRGLEAFGQAAEALRAVAEATDGRAVRAAFYDPRRPGVRHPSTLTLDEAAITLASAGRRASLPIAEVTALGITLSPLVGRITAVGPSSTIALRFPAPLAAGAAAWLRSARRALANC